MVKKYIFLILVVILFLLTFNKSNNSYAYICDNIISPKEVSTNNLEDYLTKNGISNIISFCSYDYCYNIREDNISQSISNFKKIYNKYLSEDDYLQVKIKGYPITIIKTDEC